MVFTKYIHWSEPHCVFHVTSVTVLYKPSLEFSHPPRQIAIYGWCTTFRTNTSVLTTHSTTSDVIYSSTIVNHTCLCKHITLEDWCQWWHAHTHWRTTHLLWTYRSSYISLSFSDPIKSFFGPVWTMHCLSYRPHCHSYVVTLLSLRLFFPFFPFHLHWLT